MNFNSSIDPAGTHLVDINGDGRADWIYRNNNTLADIRINQRGDRSDGPGLVPHWRAHSQEFKSWPDDDRLTSELVLFGKVFGTGRNDIIRVEEMDDETVMSSTSTAILVEVALIFAGMVCDIATCMVEVMISEASLIQKHT